MSQITTGQLVSIFQELENELFLKAKLQTTLGGHELTTAEQALYLDALADRINSHFKIRRVRGNKAIDDKWDLQAIKDLYPPCLHQDYIKKALEYLREDIKSDEDYQKCLAAVKAFRHERLKAESENITNRKFTMKFSRWVKQWRELAVITPALVEPKVLDASEMGF